MPPPAVTGVWGLGPWGLGTWGGIGGPSFAAVSPIVAEVRGGTVVGIFGTGFADPTTIEILDAGNIVRGRAYYFEARLDLRPKKVLVGLPPLPAGVYGIRITTPAGISPIIPNVITYKEFADEGKVLRMRRRFAQIWATGERITV